ncbi:MFS transporter [Nocardia sp. NBC_00508]|uniref:MFS transporter n=1 Tax=Nocardia sp. NBC_00508 TaxID=2975992 RepID=UPI002E7FFD04|nr:MFS transporter [Nocardia sp. NBC_00508]WUD66295.1 MFS transporter [Nocardia sp. NBC_00508]
MNATQTPNRTGVFTALRETPRPVVYLLIGVLVNQLGAFVQTFLVLYLTHREFTVGQAGLALTAYSAGAVFGTMLGGELTHRIGPRPTIIAAMTGSAALLALIPLLSRPGLYAVLLIAVATTGLVTQAYRPAAAVLLGDLMPEEHRVMGFSMMRIALNIGAALAPLVAAAVILIDWNLLLWLDALTALAYAALALLLLPKVAAPQDEKEQSPKQSRGYGVILRDRRYHLFLASVLVGSIIYVQYTVALPLNIEADGFSTGLYSAVLVTASVTLILCELKITAYVKHLRPHLVGAVGTAIMGLGVAGYALAGLGPVPIILATIVFVSGVMVNGPTMFAYPSTFPAAVRARYIGTHQATFGLGMALGPALGVLAWTQLGEGIWPLCGALGVFAAWCAYAGIRENKAVRAETESSADEPTS